MYLPVSVVYQENGYVIICISGLPVSVVYQE